MTKWLASIRCLKEAETLLPLSPDIIDMKDPSQGSLGALPSAEVKKIVKAINGTCQTSATIGDLPMTSTIISDAIVDMAESGVDYIKIGLFADNNLSHCIGALTATPLSTLKKAVIGVIFADEAVNIDIIPLLANGGFRGVMLDTASKQNGSLPSLCTVPTLTAFINAAHQHKLLCGLAGALRVEDIQTLAPLGADYLGFRSALCDNNQRTAPLRLTNAKAIADELKTNTGAGTLC